MTSESTETTSTKPAKKAAKKPSKPRPARPAAPVGDKQANVPVEYLVDYGEFKKGDTGKLPVSEAWRLSWRNVVRQTNTQK